MIECNYKFFLPCLDYKDMMYLYSNTNVFIDGKKVKVQIKGEGDRNRDVPMFVILKRNQ